jgi:hypothetical protein
MIKPVKIFACAFLMFAFCALPALAEEAWWQYSYEGDTTPQNSKPAFELIEPNIKSGMMLKDTVKDGILSATCLGEGATHYFQIGWVGSTQVWRPDSELGTTVEIRTRVAQAPEKFTTTAIFSMTGYSPEGNRPFVIYFGPKMIIAMAKVYPVDMSQFHVFRITFDPSSKTFVLYQDGKKLMDTPLDKIAPEKYKSSKILLGFTYGPSLQGTLDVDYLRWTSKGAIAP